MIYSLKKIFPLHFILLALIPILVGCIIDIELIELRLIVIQLIWIVLLLIVLNIIKIPVLYRIVLTLYFLIGCIEIVHWVILKAPISLTSLLVLSNTTLNESFGFMEAKSTFWLTILVPYLIIYIFSIQSKQIQFNLNIKNWVVWLLFSAASFFLIENLVHERLIRKGTPLLIRVIDSYISQKTLFDEVAANNEPKNILVKNNSTSPSNTFVVILGESCNRNHMSLYGYNRNTSPKLGKRKDVISFDNVISPYSNTINSVLSILSNHNLENNIKVNKRIDLIDLFHSANYSTHWISNQSPIGIWDNQVTVFANKSDHVTHVNLSSSSSFESTYTTSYDNKVLEPFIKTLHSSAKNKLIVVHLMGNHISYRKRYPQEFDFFKGNSEKNRTIAKYDNSILYNDYIVDSILSILATDPNTKYSSAIYLSDHGENVYDDELNRTGHNYSKTIPKANVEIPFIFWASESFKKMNIETVNTILKHKNKRFISDDLFHSVLDLNSIETEYLIQSRSVFNQNYNSKRIRILEDGYDYDEK